MVYVLRYYMSRSLHRTDRYLVTAAAVLLASKVQESPRGVDDVSMVCVEAKYANKKNVWQHPQDKALYLAEFKRCVLLAEQAILWSLNFNIVVPANLVIVKEYVKELHLSPPPLGREEAEGVSLLEAQARRDLHKFTMGVINDSYKTSLCLQHTPHKVAAVSLLFAAKLLKKRAESAGVQVPLCYEDLLDKGMSWLLNTFPDLMPEVAADMEEQLSVLYLPAPVKHQPAAGAAAPAQQQQLASAGQPTGAGLPPADALKDAQQQEQQSVPAGEAKPSTSMLAAPRTPPAQSTPVPADGSPQEEGEVSASPSDAVQQCGAAQEASSAAAGACLGKRKAASPLRVHMSPSKAQRVERAGASLDVLIGAA